LLCLDHLVGDLEQLLDALVRDFEPLDDLASVNSSAPPSTMTIESRDPETVRSTSENSSCWKVGFSIHAPSTRPTRTAAIGPFHGTLESDSAVEAATTPRTSESFS